MPAAQKTDDLKEHKVLLKKEGSRKTKMSSIQGKTFKSLSDKEKDTLLELLGVRLGLIKDSDD